VAYFEQSCGGRGVCMYVCVCVMNLVCGMRDYKETAAGTGESRVKNSTHTEPHTHHFTKPSQVTLSLLQNQTTKY
jgi:hypothetical protein